MINKRIVCIRQKEGKIYKKNRLIVSNQIT